MGHLRLGRLPKTRRWQQVVELLDTAPEDTAGIAAAVVLAADSRLRDLASDPSPAYCFWLLTRIAWASRGRTFVGDLAGLGIEVANDSSVLAFISQVADRVRAELSRQTSSGHFTELGSLALRRALSETAGQHGPSLFGSSVDDLQQAFRVHSTRDQFGALSRRFFGDFLARTLRSFVDRELSQHVGGTSGIANVADSLEFTQALDTFARQSARIIEDFAAGWYSKHNWEAKGEITEEDAQKFVAVALRKLRMEVKLGAAEP